MQYVKFATPEEAEEYKVILQARHDVTNDPLLPRIIDCPVVTHDGKIAMTLQDKDVDFMAEKITFATEKDGKISLTPTIDAKVLAANPWLDTKAGVVVDTIEPPKVEMDD